MASAHDFSGFRRLRHFVSLSLVATLGFGVIEAGAASSATLPQNARRSEKNAPTALDLYVAAPDTNYAWKVVSTTRGSNYTASILQLTSQSWLTTNEVDRPLWQHWLSVVKPDSAKSDTAFLFISGGGNKSGAPKKPDDNVLNIALATHGVVAELKGVPSQPLVFAGEQKGRSEDSLIAYTWDKYLRTGDERWPARLPMTKSAVRAMDAVTEFCSTEEGGKFKVNHFMVAGGSKRGWTTWTAAIVDKRVVAIAPIVIDMLNIVPSFIHHWETYGFWAPAVGDYVQNGIMDWTGTKEYANLMKIEEPYEYRDRLTMPKFIVNACGDQFFLPDSSQFYFKDLQGTKYLRYVPNADHSLRGSDAWESIACYFDAIVKKAALPKFTWTKEEDGTLRVKTTDKPSSVKLWQANNPKARDFRLEAVGKIWQGSPLEDQGGGVYLGKVAKPAEGWTAYMVELTFPSTGPTPFKFTTEVAVNPNTTLHKYVQPKHP